MFEKIKTFLKESYQEFKKVRWPSREELISLTVAIVICSILLLIFIGGIDQLFYQAIKWVLR